MAIETFAVDYIRIVDGRFYAGNGTQNTDSFGYELPIRSVAHDKVVSAVDDRSEVPPFIVDNPTLTSPSDFCGNGLVVKIEPRLFAHYCHMPPGSVRIEVGERVRTGRSSACSATAGTRTDRTCTSGSRTDRKRSPRPACPFEIDRYRLEGTSIRHDA